MAPSGHSPCTSSRRGSATPCTCGGGTVCRRCRRGGCSAASASAAGPVRRPTTASTRRSTSSPRRASDCGRRRCASTPSPASPGCAVRPPPATRCAGSQSSPNWRRGWSRPPRSCPRSRPVEQETAFGLVAEVHWMPIVDSTIGDALWSGRVDAADLRPRPAAPRRSGAPRCGRRRSSPGSSTPPRAPGCTRRRGSRRCRPTARPAPPSPAPCSAASPARTPVCSCLGSPTSTPSAPSRSTSAAPANAPAANRS